MRARRGALDYSGSTLRWRFKIVFIAVASDLYE
jgi:hypothetical protein